LVIIRVDERHHGGRWRDHVGALVDAARTLSEQLGCCSLGGGLIPILRVLSASVMSRALIRPFPVPPGAVS
jgi:hypothetical protein